MKKFVLFLAITFITGAFSFGQTELYYDNDTYSGWLSFIPERVFAVHFSPTGPCEVLVLKYYVQKQGASEGAYVTSLYEWDGSMPANNAVYEQLTVVITEGWKEQNVEGSITFDGDFVVGYKPMDPSAYLAADDALNTGRNWIFDITNTVWTEVTEHTYLIRAIVEYSTGETEELEGIPISVYPNPATDVLIVETSPEDQKISMINAVGQTVFNSTIVSENTSIDLSAFESGFYFLRIESERGISTRKVIIQ